MVANNLSNTLLVLVVFFFLPLKIIILFFQNACLDLFLPFIYKYYNFNNQCI